MIIPQNLWRAEWIKARQHPVNRGLLMLTVAAIILLFVSTIIGAVVSPDRFLPNARRILPMPNGLLTITELLGSMGPIIAVIFMANSVGSEYSSDTWKMIMPRYGSRRAFIVAKILTGGAAMCLWIAILMIIGQLLGWVGAAFLHITADQVTDRPDFAAYLRYLAIDMLQMTLYGMLAFVFAVTLRSTVVGVLGGFAAIFVLNVVAFIFRPLTLVLPSSHIQNIAFQWVLRDPIATEQLTSSFGFHISPLISFFVVLIYISIFIWSVLYIFQTRDIEGE